MSRFDTLYNKIAVRKNYIEPKYPRMDNWSIDLYETADGWFAGMSDAGYARWVGRRDAAGNIIWRVSDRYPKPLEYSGISVDEFESLTC